jgi:thiol-disulfide isomerase/thioredoxin
MAKKINLKFLNKKFELKPQHVEIILIIVTLLMGICVVYLYKNKIESELKENYKNHNDNNNQKKLLLFYAPWCGASKSFLPTWNILTKDLNTETYDVDLEENKQISNSFNIQYLPTLYLVNGNNRIKYEGDRSYDELVSFYNSN